MGAAVLSARAALKSGAGLATVHSASCGIWRWCRRPCLRPFSSLTAREHFISDTTPHHNHQVIAAGPGIGTRDETVNALESLIKTTTTPLVLDADALNCIAKRPALLRMLPPATVITPRVAGEFDRIFGESGCSEQRAHACRGGCEEIQHHHCPQGAFHCDRASYGPGLLQFHRQRRNGHRRFRRRAYGGDRGFLTAQGYRPEHAASVGVYVHGMAGDIAAEEKGEFGMTAGDIADNVGRAITRILNGNFESKQSLL